MSSNDFSEKLRLLRKKHNLTLEQIANIVGVGKSTVRKWEVGMIANVRRDKIGLLAKALHTTPAYLMGWEEENSPEQNELSEGEKIWLSLYNKLSEEAREAIITTASALEQLPAESQKIFLSMLRGALGSQA